MSQRFPRRLARLLRRPQSLRYVSGRFTSYKRFVTFEGQERHLTLLSGAVLRGRDPAVAIGPGGKALIVYEGAAGRGLRYVTGSLNSDGKLVGQDYPLIEADVCIGYDPAIAVDQAGRVLVVYQGPKQGELMYVSGFLDPSGRILGRRFSLTQVKARRGSTPSVGLDGHGRVVLAYQGAREGKLWCFMGTVVASGRIHGAESQLTEDKTRQSRHPTVAVDNERNVVILYAGPRDHRLRYVHGSLQTGRLADREKSLTIGMERR